jgi:FtsH-binding integral membrane protein
MSSPRSRISRRRLWSAGNNSVLLVLVVGLFLVAALERRDPALVAPAALIAALFVVARTNSVKSLIRAEASALLPFALILVVLGRQQTYILWDALLGIFLLYVLARLLRLVLSGKIIALGIGISGLTVGALSLIDAGILPINVGFLAPFVGLSDRNPTGWVLAFAVAATIAALAFTSMSRMLRILVWPLFGLSFVSLIFVQSVASLVASIVAIVTVSALVLYRSGRRVTGSQNGPAGEASSRLAWQALFYVGLAALTTFVVLAITGAQALGRDWEDLTGRVPLWDCYFEQAGLGEVVNFQQVQECAGFEAAHTHSIYLESHLISSWPALVALLLGLAVVLARTLSEVLFAADESSVAEAALGLSLVVVGVTVGLAEAYLFSSLGFGALALFMAEPVSYRIRILSRVRSLRPR